MNLQDEELIQNLKDFGYRISLDKFEINIKRKIRAPLLLWIIVVLFGGFLLAFPMNPFMLISGTVLIFTPFMLYRWNVATKVKLDHFNRRIIYQTGVFGIKHYRKYEDVKHIRLRTYDVQSSASPFYKGARAYIANIRIYWTDSGSLELFYFERRDQQNIKFAEYVHRSVADFTGLHNTVANMP